MVGLFTRYGLADFAKQQGMLALSHDESGNCVLPVTAVAVRAKALRK
jgi:hypothetical protein